ncbi:hypothetical protein BO99DRAFT_482359 [Aspergillus violaceofuscus CBS 115571]|uniref:Uncharacterized protein n=1 Tax=Aspergillus violaceofuscus (strain CBS 115571) TaxID=1450538 RepID=A0A2V5I3V3_ASPV1|nr:hypothetical protein BO99DRAFT_482359 [Aspergillus violaceofuscus CBS 115571]
MHYPWQQLSDWQPFRLDALGLITLLGAEDIDIWVGRLVPSKWLEYMPLLAMYCQRLSETRSIIYWEIIEEPHSLLSTHLKAAGTSACLIGPLFVMTILSGDFYGLANVCAIMLSVWTRAYILCANRATIDQSIKSTFNTYAKDKFNKIMIKTPESKMVTIFVQQSLTVPIFIKNLQPSSYILYRFARWLNWLAFGIHVVTLGMAALSTQIYTVLLVLVPSILICVGFGCADKVPPRPLKTHYGITFAYTCWIGSHLKATIFEWPSHLDFKRVENDWFLSDNDGECYSTVRSNRRLDLYAWVNPTQEEEDSLIKWNLLPHRREENLSWYHEFESKKALIQGGSYNIFELKDVISKELEESENQRKAIHGYTKVVLG